MSAGRSVPDPADTGNGGAQVLPLPISPNGNWKRLRCANVLILRPLKCKMGRAMTASSDDELDDFQIRFQQAYGARLFRQGKPRALLEVKSPDVPTAIYEARLRGYDRAAAKDKDKERS
jgi:hypothetical protein